MCFAGGATVGVERMLVGRSLVFVIAAAGANWQYLVEVTPVPTGGYAARVFTATLPPSDSPAATMVTCAGTGGGTLDAVGTVVVSDRAFADPLDAHAELDLTLEDRGVPVEDFRLVF